MPISSIRTTGLTVDIRSAHESAGLVNGFNAAIIQAPDPMGKVDERDSHEPDPFFMDAEDDIAASVLMAEAGQPCANPQQMYQRFRAVHHAEIEAVRREILAAKKQREQERMQVKAVYKTGEELPSHGIKIVIPGGGATRRAVPPPKPMAKSAAKPVATSVPGIEIIEPGGGVTITGIVTPLIALAGPLPNAPKTPPPRLIPDWSGEDDDTDNT